MFSKKLRDIHKKTLQTCHIKKKKKNHNKKKCYRHVQSRLNRIPRIHHLCTWQFNYFLFDILYTYIYTYIYIYIYMYIYVCVWDIMTWDRAHVKTKKDGVDMQKDDDGAPVKDAIDATIKAQSDHVAVTTATQAESSTNNAVVDKRDSNTIDILQMKAENEYNPLRLNSNNNNNNNNNNVYRSRRASINDLALER
ncbi:hypothetical protein RFI_09811, partial [Reticulomyxa filosa]